MANKSFVFRFNDVEVREREFSLTKAGEVLPVEPKAFRVLLALLRNPGKLIAKEELLNAVWGDAAVTDNSLARSVALLRRLLGDETRNPRYIETVATVGYRFVCKVEVLEDATAGLDKPEEPENAANLQTPIAANLDKDSGGKLSLGSRLRLRWWLLSGAIVLVMGLAAAVWYLRRPLPPLRVAEYTQITHDGRLILDIGGTDGSRLYFNRELGPQSTAQVAISGGEIAEVPVALPFPWTKDVSPDGSTLLVTSYDGKHGSLWSVSMPAGSLRRLLQDTSTVESAAWSPDGKSVVYSLGDADSLGNGDIYVIGSDGTGARKLAAMGGYGGYPDGLSWSPDDSKIRFSWNNRLWEMSFDGSGLHPLLPGWLASSSLCCGRWSPDGNFFVFLSRGSLWNHYGFRPGSQVWVLDERRGLFRRASTEPVQLTSGPIRWNSPIPSKDGTKIFAHGLIERGELVRYDAQSGRFQPYLGGISAEAVIFSPDGQFVAYVTFPEGILWKANRDGSHPVQLTEAPLYPLNPHWSPDGSQILFCSEDSKGLKAYVISSQGGTPFPILPEDRDAQSHPDWSPDGHKIVFSTLYAIKNFNSVLRIFDLDSRKVTTLSGSEGVWAPRWSPNGRFILGLYRGSGGGVKVIDLETQQWSMVQRKGECNYPTWSSDSQFIYCMLFQDDPGVFRARVSGGDAERVVDLKGFRHTGAFSRYMGLDPTDTPMLLLDVGTDDIYALTLEER